MKKQLLTALVFITLSCAANAQIRFALEPGLNIADYKVTTISERGGVSMGVRSGGVADIRLNSHLSVQPGVFYVMNGLKETVYYSSPLPGQIDLKSSFGTIEVPVNVIYTFGSAGGNRFFIGAGPYLGINAGGKFSSTDMGVTSTRSLKFGSERFDDFKRIDAGAGVNAGYEFKFGLFVRARYQRGFTNLLPTTSFPGFSIHSSGYGISVGYFFSKRIEPKAKSVSHRK